MTIKREIKLLIHFQTSTLRPLEFGNWYVISSCTLPGMSLLIYTAKKSFRSHLAASVTAVILTISDTALSVNPRVSASEVSFVLKDMSRVVNFVNWQWVWKHLIVHIRLLKNLFSYNTLLTKNVFFELTCRIPSKYSSENPVWNPVHITKIAMQKDSPCKYVYLGSSYYRLN